MDKQSWAKIACIPGVVLVFTAGLYFGGHDMFLSGAAERSLRDEIVRLKSALRAASQESVALKQAAAVDREAYGVVERNLRSQQDEIAELRKEIAFYRGMVNVGEQRSGLHIQSFQVRGSEGLPDFDYRLILTQYMKSNRTVDGHIELRIEGMQDDRPMNLGKDRIRLSPSSKARFHFKYFQELTGGMVLPERFSPVRIVVRAVFSDGKHAVVERTFPWEAVYRH